MKYLNISPFFMVFFFFDLAAARHQFLWPSTWKTYQTCWGKYLSVAFVRLISCTNTSSHRTNLEKWIYDQLLLINLLTTYSKCLELWMCTPLMLVVEASSLRNCIGICFIFCVILSDVPSDNTSFKRHLVSRREWKHDWFLLYKN